ncbi:MAG: hypothetical protein WCQ99_07025 [Pseudomonadota bacterium]
MPVTNWLFSDGAWFDWDTASPTYRHVHLYETSEVRRTAVFFVAIKNFPLERQRIYERYLENMEQHFHHGRFRFHLLFNNCTRVINNILYREQWLRKSPLDSIPAISFKRLVKALKNKQLPFASGYLHETNPARFKTNHICFGLLTLAPEKHLARWLARSPGFLSPGSSPAGITYA